MKYCYPWPFSLHRQIERTESAKMIKGSSRTLPIAPESNTKKWVSNAGHFRVFKNNYCANRPIFQNKSKALKPAIIEILYTKCKLRKS